MVRIGNELARADLWITWRRQEQQRPAKLSGGERQRVAVARALANKPPIVLADEPTGRLDSESGQMILDLLAEIRERRGLTVILVTHERAVTRASGRIVHMLDGRVDESGREPGSPGGIG